jgi:hypothetical protein
MDAFFGVTKGLSVELKVGCARRLHVALRVLHFAKRNGAEQNFEFIASNEFSKCGGSSNSVH